jgi:UDP-glucose 4-epimerase
MKVLITGATGFIGRSIADHLIEQGMEIIALDKRPVTIEGLSKSIRTDIGEASVAERIAYEINSCDAIVHAAAAIDMSLYNSDIVLANCLGTQQLLHSAEILKARNFIYLSSVPIIGIPKQLPVNEDHSANPLTAYHASKLFGEHLVRIASSGSLSGTILRLTSPIGPGMPDNRILSVFVKKSLANMPLQLLGEGTRRQNYVDVRDIAVVVRQCLQRPFSGIFNIAGRTSISNVELAKRCIRILGSSSEIQFAGVPDPEEGVDWDVSIAKAEKLLAYNPQHDIDNSISVLGSQYVDRLH